LYLHYNTTSAQKQTSPKLCPRGSQTACAAIIFVTQRQMLPKLTISMSHYNTYCYQVTLFLISSFLGFLRRHTLTQTPVKQYPLC